MGSNGQLIRFDADAKALSLASLRRDLPKLIRDLEKPVTYLELREACAVNTPASAEIFKTSVMNAVQDNELLLQTAKGRTRRSALQIIGSDIIRSPQQRSFLHLLNADRKGVLVQDTQIVNSLQNVSARLQ